MVPLEIVSFGMSTEGDSSPRERQMSSTVTDQLGTWRGPIDLQKA